MSAQQNRMRDLFFRKIKRPKSTAAGKAAEVFADIVRANIRHGYVSLLGSDDKWKPLWEDYEDRVGWDPGQVRTEDLLNSVEVKDMGDGSFEVVVNDPKAVLLEYGGFATRRDGTPVPPRPFFRPAVHYFEHNNIANSIMIEEVEGLA